MKTVTIEQCIDAARLAYLEGHNDTVESRFADPQETAENIVTELLSGTHPAPSEHLERILECYNEDDTDATVGALVYWVECHEAEERDRAEKRR